MPKPTSDSYNPLTHGLEIKRIASLEGSSSAGNLENWNPAELFSREGPITLFEAQLAGLKTIEEAEGRAFLQIPVGCGKTLITFLAPWVVGADRTVLFTPHGVAEQAQDNYLDWDSKLILPPLGLFTYENLSSKKHAELLFDFAPDYIIMDEAHRISNPDNVRFRRLREYVRQKDVPVTVLSGTLLRAKVSKTATLLSLLFEDKSFLPRQELILKKFETIFMGNYSDQEWVRAFREAYKVPSWVGKSTPAIVENARERISEIKGVYIYSHSSAKDIPLTFFTLPVPKDAEIETTLTELKESGELLGQAITGGEELWRLENQVRQGFLYETDWDAIPGGKDFERIADEKLWFKAVAEELRIHACRGYDSPSLIDEWCRNNQDSGLKPKLLDFWRAKEKHAGKPNPPRNIKLVSSYYVDWLFRVLETMSRPTVIWVRSDALEIALASKLPDIKDTEFGRGSQEHCYAKIQKYGTGKQLQTFSSAIIADWSREGLTMEQLIARHHREGQSRAVDIFLPQFYGDEESLKKLKESAFNEQAISGAPQKLLLGGWYAGDVA